MFSDEEFEMDVKGTGDNIPLKIMTKILVTECYALAMTSFNISSFCVAVNLTIGVHYTTKVRTQVPFAL